jgi:hypothetical protein
MIETASQNQIRVFDEINDGNSTLQKSLTKTLFKRITSNYTIISFAFRKRSKSLRGFLWVAIGAHYASSSLSMTLLDFQRGTSSFLMPKTWNCISLWVVPRIVWKCKAIWTDWPHGARIICSNFHSVAPPCHCLLYSQWKNSRACVFYDRFGSHLDSHWFCRQQRFRNVCFYKALVMGIPRSLYIEGFVCHLCSL